MYRIEISPAVIKFLGRLNRSQKNIAERIGRSIDSLAEDPFKGKKLIGQLGDFRSLRVGEYRVIYQIVQNEILIQVAKIAHRREVYR